MKFCALQPELTLAATDPAGGAPIKGGAVCTLPDLQNASEAATVKQETASQRFAPGYVWRHDGFHLLVVDRLGSVVMVKKTYPGSRWTGFEVAIVRDAPARVVCGRPIAAGEVYPSSEQWGLSGWSYGDLEHARNRFCKLTGGTK